MLFIRKRLIEYLSEEEELLCRRIDEKAFEADNEAIGSKITGFIPILLRCSLWIKGRDTVVQKRRSP